jgi:hypothetical protein
VTGDAKPGAVVEMRAYEDRQGRKRSSLATRSDLTIEAQVAAPGATWIDRQLLAKEATLSGSGFGAEVREAMDRRVEHLVGEGLARRQGQRVIFARDLLNTLRQRDLSAAATKLTAETGLAYSPSVEGEHVVGVYPAGTVAPFALLSPCTGILSSALVFGERFSPLRYVGMALIIAGLAIILLPAWKRTTGRRAELRDGVSS